MFAKKELSKYEKYKRNKNKGSFVPLAKKYNYLNNEEMPRSIPLRHNYHEEQEII